VTLKLAMSLDGQTATAPGDSPWISGEASRQLVHRWRAESDAIAAGIGTVLADDPLLTARVPGARQPLRVVFDSEARLPCSSRLLATLDTAPLLVVVAPDADPARLSALRDSGAEILLAGGLTPADRILSALTDLGRRGITSLFLEGGPTLASAFADADQLDESRTFIAPVLLGNTSSSPRAGGAGVGAPRGAEDAQHPSTVGETPVTGPARRSALETSHDKIGDDLLISAMYKEW
jgi:diaminohydroxyphosphoribosylaminopyrimidine deaminase/5-amino-6-(5-phosphoribosylamino)uracil reductase